MTDVTVTHDCPRCVGFGTIAYFGDADVTCPDCGGSGRKRHRQSATAPLIAALEEAREALATAERVMLWANPRMACGDYAKVIANDVRNTGQALTRITAELAKHKGNGNA